VRFTVLKITAFAQSQACHGNQKSIRPSEKIHSIMPDDCPSFLLVGGYLFIFILSAAMLFDIVVYSFSVSQLPGPVGYIAILIFALAMGYSAYKMYRSLFPACWL
jgi:hypothetical protein